MLGRSAKRRRWMDVELSAKWECLSRRACERVRRTWRELNLGRRWVKADSMNARGLNRL
jgi:hypothetical protein